MRKKLQSKAGMTLIEILAALLILVFLVLGMGVGMDAGSRIYREAVFQSESASLAGILNTSLGDILRYSSEVKIWVDEVNGEDQKDWDTALKKYNADHGFKLKKTDLISKNQRQTLLERGDDQVGFIFTSTDYGIRDAYFYTPLDEDGTYKGVLLMRNLRNEAEVELVNGGSYPNLVVTNFTITYSPRMNPGIEGGYFALSYTIYSSVDPSKSKEVECIIRHLNDGQ